MLKDIARPVTPVHFTCPRCEHSINEHNAATPNDTLCGAVCLCDWTPEDIASWHIVGSLTPMAAVPTPATRKPLGAWE